MSELLLSIMLMQTSAAGQSVGAAEIPIPVIPALERYSDCIDRAPPVRANSFRELIDEQIRLCAEVRASAIAEGLERLAQAPDFRDPERRRIAVNRPFDDWDEMRRGMLERHLERQRRGEPDPQVTSTRKNADD